MVKAANVRFELHNSIHASAITLPHCSEPRLATNVPQLYRDIAFGYFSHIKSNSGYHVLCELTRLF